MRSGDQSWPAAVSHSFHPMLCAMMSVSFLTTTSRRGRFPQFINLSCWWRSWWRATVNTNTPHITCFDTTPRFMLGRLRGTLTSLTERVNWGQRSKWNRGWLPSDFFFFISRETKIWYLLKCHRRKKLVMRLWDIFLAIFALKEGICCVPVTS